MNAEDWTPIKDLAIKLVKNMTIIAFIFIISKYLKGEQLLIMVNDNMPKVSFLLIFIPWVALSFLYPFTKYGVLILIGLLIPKNIAKKMERIYLNVLMILTHFITIILWVAIISNKLKTAIDIGPSSRVEQFLGL